MLGVEDFVVRAALAGAGVSLFAAPLGCFIVWRRMAYYGETVAHSGLLGVALGFLLGIDLTLGIIAVAVVLSLLLVLLQRQYVLPQDSVLGILAHVALAAGLIAAQKLVGQRVELMGYLFGDILAITPEDLLWILVGGVLVLAVLARFWRPMLAISVHEELAAVEGVKVDRCVWCLWD